MKLLKILLIYTTITGCAVQTTKSPVYLSTKHEQWKSEILRQCEDKAHELTLIVYSQNIFLDVEQLMYIEKRFQDKCVVQNNLSI